MSLGVPEIEAATADAIAGEIGRASRHALPVGSPCPNCGTPLKGAWCYACGQKGEAYDRSILHLAGEALEGLTHFDGRFWFTVPRLAWRPGKLTRSYLDGHRAPQIPPFRLFLIVLLLVFFVGGANEQFQSNVKFATLDSPEVQKNLTAKDRADLEQAREAMRIKLGKGAQGETAGAHWLRERLAYAMGHQEAFKAAIGEWAHRFAFLTLPVAALLLTVLFAFKKGVYVFDHLVFSMHSLSFQGLLVTAAMLGSFTGDWAWQLLWLSPVHLFVHMRGTYGSSIFGTLVRMSLLFLGSSIAFAFLVAGLFLVGLATVH